MFGLCYGLWKTYFRKAQYQVLILGLDYAGKTTFLEQMKTIFNKAAPIQPQKIPPTVGLNIARIQSANATMVFWDLGGQSGLRVIWDKYYAEAHCIVFVVDSTDSARLADAEKEIEKCTANAQLSRAPLLVLANKQDLPGALSAAAVADVLEIDQYRHGHTPRAAQVMPISALTGRGVEEAVQWLLEVLPDCERTRQLGNSAD